MVSRAITAPKICNSFDLTNFHPSIDQIKEQLNCWGYWFSPSVKIILLHQIQYHEWKPERTARNTKLISETGTVLPIEIEYNREKKIYEVIDGNQRCVSCEQLGYTAIPAVIYKKCRYGIE